MKRLFLIMLLLPLLAACTGGAAKEDAPASLSGPSLVMFYTDN